MNFDVSTRSVKIVYSFGKHCSTENTENDYFEQKIGIK